MKKLVLSLLFVTAGFYANASNSLPFSKKCYSAKGSMSCGSDKHYFDTGCFNTAEELGQYLGELLGLICPSSE